MEGGGPAHNSRAEFPIPLHGRFSRFGPGALVDAYGDEEYGTPLVIGSRVYVGHFKKSFEARRLADGGRVWSIATRGRVAGTAAYADGLLFVADDEGYLTALRLDGSEAWHFHATYPIIASPLAAAGKVYIATSDQNIFCLEGPTGRPIWQYGRKFPRKNSQWNTPSLAWSENRCYAGFADGTVVALDADVGRVLWKAEVGKEGLFGDIVAGPSVHGDRLFAGALRGPLVCLDSGTGTEIWRQELEVSSGVAVGDTTLYVGVPAGKLVALSATDGAKLWEATLDEGVPGSPVLARDSVLVGASEGSLFAFEAKTGFKRQRWTPGSGLRGQPLVFEGGILFLANDGTMRLVADER
jgi:outer membrane protein assembly factor BamB